MRFLSAILLIAILSLIATYFLPWWTLAVVSAIVCWSFGLGRGKAFGAGFLGILVLWLVVGFVEDARNEHILSIRMAELFHLPHYGLFLLVSAVIGGLVGGLAGWTGAAIKKS